MRTLELQPSEIRYTQDSISEEFGHDKSKTIDDTYRELLYGAIDVKNIRFISVVFHDDLYWVTSGNRRLYVRADNGSVGHGSWVKWVTKS
jgi:hypothetical protein